MDQFSINRDLKLASNSFGSNSNLLKYIALLLYY